MDLQQIKFLLLYTPFQQGNFILTLIFIVLNILLTVYLAVRISLLEKDLLRFVSSQEMKIVKKVNNKKRRAAYMRGYRFRKKGAPTELPKDFVISS